MEVKTDASSSLPSLESCDKCVDQMIDTFDEDMGGFSHAPKFPQPGALYAKKFVFFLGLDYNYMAEKGNFVFLKC